MSGAVVDLTAIIPCHNEEENVQPAYAEIKRELARYGDAELLFIDDGSTDATLDRVKQLAALDPNVKYLSFSRNFGQEAAGSRGIALVRETAELVGAIREARAWSPRGRVIVEEFVTGRHFSVEAFLEDGRLAVMAVSERTVTGPPSFITVICSPPSWTRPRPGGSGTRSSWSAPPSGSGRDRSTSTWWWTTGTRRTSWSWGPVSAGTGWAG